MTLLPLTVYAGENKYPNGMGSEEHNFTAKGVEILTNPIREENEFKVKATYEYYAVNYGYWYQKWIPCATCYETGRITCTTCDGAGEWTCASCAGKGGETRTRDLTCSSSNLCQPSCNLVDWECDDCGRKNTTGGECGCGGSYTPWRDPCICPAGTETYWDECYPCDGDGIATCSLCGGAGDLVCPTCKGTTGEHKPEWVPPVRPKVLSAPIELIMEELQHTEIVTPTITKENNDSSPDGGGWEIWGNASVSATLNALENIGEKTVTSRINWANIGSETNGGDNSTDKNITVIPATNLQVEFITPNANYRAGTDVITTFIIRNQDDIGELNIRPKHKLTTEFKAINPTTNAVIASKKVEGTVIPKKGTNIVYFKWKVPDDYNKDSVKLRCDINTTKGVNEMRYDDNTVIGMNTVQKISVQETPDTTFEERAPSWFVKPNAGDNAETSRFASAVVDSTSYQRWEWKNDWYNLANYSITLEADSKLTPDVNSPSHKLVGTQFEMKSGYGFSTKTTAKAVVGAAPADAYTLPQSANMHIAEYRFSSQNNKYRTLEQTSSGVFEFYKNEYAKTDKGEKDGRRIHFTPLYYPDGEYKGKSYVYDFWTPTGMLSKIVEDKLAIKGNMYDDWYLTHSEKKN